jgi:hypothetical protein
VGPKGFNNSDTTNQTATSFSVAPNIQLSFAHCTQANVCTHTFLKMIDAIIW